MNNETNKLIPDLRFPEFVDDGEWGDTTLDEVAAILKGKGISKSDIAQNGSLPCIRYGELYTHYSETIHAIKSYTNLKAEDLVLSQANDVIIPASGETQIDIATASCVLQNGIALGGDLNIIRTEVNGVFLSYYLNNAKKKDIAQLAQGISVVHLYPSQLKTLVLNIPKPKEQQKIASCLSSLDEVIAAHNQKLEALKEHKKGLMQNLFPQDGETVPRFRFPEFLGDGEWVERKLEELAKRGSGHTPNKQMSNYYNGGIKWVSLADSNKLDNRYIYETKIQISEEGIKNSSAVLHPAGSVILSRDAGVGKSAVLYSEMAVSQHFIVWVCEESKLSNWFLYYVFQILKPVLESIAVGSTIKTIGLPYFKELLILVPPINEQRKIAACLTSLDESITAEAERIEQLKLHKKGLMQGLFPKPITD